MKVYNLGMKEAQKEQHSLQAAIGRNIARKKREEFINRDLTDEEIRDLNLRYNLTDNYLDFAIDIVAANFNNLPRD